MLCFWNIFATSLCLVIRTAISETSIEHNGSNFIVNGHLENSDSFSFPWSEVLSLVLVLSCLRSTLKWWDFVVFIYWNTRNLVIHFPCCLIGPVKELENLTFCCTVYLKNIYSFMYAPRTNWVANVIWIINC